MSLSEEQNKFSLTNIPEYQTMILEEDQLQKEINDNMSQILNIINPGTTNIQVQRQIEEEVISRKDKANGNKSESITTTIVDKDPVRINSQRIEDVKNKRDLETALTCLINTNKENIINPNLSNLIKINIPFEEKLFNYINLVHLYFKDFKYEEDKEESKIKGIILLSAIMIQKAFQGQSDMKQDITTLAKIVSNNLDFTKKIGNKSNEMSPKVNGVFQNQDLFQLKEEVLRLKDEVAYVRQQLFNTNSQLNQVNNDEINRKKILCELNTSFRNKSDELRNIIFSTLNNIKESESSINNGLSNTDYYNLDTKLRLIQNQVNEEISIRKQETNTIRNQLNSSLDLSNLNKQRIDSLARDRANLNRSNNDIPNTNIRDLLEKYNNLEREVFQIKNNMQALKEEISDGDEQSYNQIIGIGNQLDETKEKIDKWNKEISSLKKTIKDNKTNSDSLIKQIKDKNNEIDQLNKDNMKTLKENWQQQKNQLEELIKRNSTKLEEKETEISKIKNLNESVIKLNETIELKESKKTVEDKLEKIGKEYKEKLEQSLKDNQVEYDKSIKAIEDKIRLWENLDFSKKYNEMKEKCSELENINEVIKKDINKLVIKTNSFDDFIEKDKKKDRISLDEIRENMTLSKKNNEALVKYEEICNSNKLNIKKLEETLKENEEKIEKISKEFKAKDVDGINQNNKEMFDKINKEILKDKEDRAKLEKAIQEIKNNNSKIIEELKNKDIKNVIDIIAEKDDKLSKENKEKLSVWEGKFKSLELTINNNIKLLQTQLNERNNKLSEEIKLYNDEQSRFSEKIELTNKDLDLKLQNFEEFKNEQIALMKSLKDQMKEHEININNNKELATQKTKEILKIIEEDRESNKKNYKQNKDLIDQVESKFEEQSLIINNQVIGKLQELGENQQKILNLNQSEESDKYSIIKEEDLSQNKKDITNNNDLNNNNNMVDNNIININNNNVKNNNDDLNIINEQIKESNNVNNNFNEKYITEEPPFLRKDMNKFNFDIDQQNLSAKQWANLDQAHKTEFIKQKEDFRKKCREQIEQDFNLSNEEKDRKLQMLDYYRYKYFENGRWHDVRSYDRKRRNFPKNQKKKERWKQQNSSQNQNIQNQLNYLISLMKDTKLKSNQNLNQNGRRRVEMNYDIINQQRNYQNPNNNRNMQLRSNQQYYQNNLGNRQPNVYQNLNNNRNMQSQQQMRPNQQYYQNNSENQRLNLNREQRYQGKFIPNQRNQNRNQNLFQNQRNSLQCRSNQQYLPANNSNRNQRRQQSIDNYNRPLQQSHNSNNYIPINGQKNKKENMRRRWSYSNNNAQN